MKLSEATEIDLMVEFMKRRRLAGEQLITRSAAVEVRHVCLYTAQALNQLREDAVRPGIKPGHVIVELKSAIADLEALVTYLEGKGGGTSALGDRNKR